MAKMTKDLMLNDNKFSTAVSDMKALKKRTNQLKNDLNSYKPVGLGFYKKKEKHAWE